MSEVVEILDYSLGGRVRRIVEGVSVVENVVVLLYVFKVVFYDVFGIGICRNVCKQIKIFAYLEGIRGVFRSESFTYKPTVKGVTCVRSDGYCYFSIVGINTCCRHCTCYGI